MVSKGILIVSPLRANNSEPTGPHDLPVSNYWQELPPVNKDPSPYPSPRYVRSRTAKNTSSSSPTASPEHTQNAVPRTSLVSPVSRARRAMAHRPLAAIIRNLHGGSGVIIVSPYAAILAHCAPPASTMFDDLSLNQMRTRQLISEVKDAYRLLGQQGFFPPEQTEVRAVHAITSEQYGEVPPEQRLAHPELKELVHDLMAPNGDPRFVEGMYSPFHLNSSGRYSEQGTFGVRAIARGKTRPVMPEVLCDGVVWK
ncbi:hypothetical protein BT63DRAFT_455621 [Microthyrium microscopicum]|uniref:Uncharacterized protein n=1 Tax=Microthyrium microscopicum TaxID=703497 RepID=A0A6A6UCP2_9PEZI|nr:hypothetical protein BT63DRAFT_455621 [Microthyrium microscopicum]